MLLPLLLLLLLSPGRGHTGDGCGPTVLGPQSGTLASGNYPSTYPNNTRCEWGIRMAEGPGLTFAFGDMDLEYSDGCSSGFLTVSSPSQGISYGPYCGNQNQVPKTLQLNSSDATVLFISTTHRSGRGFLLSYASTDHPDLISCLDKGIHYSSQRVSVYCPAGCKDIAGDIWGQAAPGYRDTSVLCKAAIHAGVISDDLGGPVTFAREKGITRYEAASANGLQSKTGPLSEKRILFDRDCIEVLDITQFRASSSWREADASGGFVTWAAEQARFHASTAPGSWAAEGISIKEWLEMDLGGRKNITGIVTRGSPDSRHRFYVTEYKVLSSRDGKTWKLYKSSRGKDEKVFEGNTDSQQAAYNTFIPPIVSRYLRIAPQSWNLRIALKVELLGCLATRVRSTSQVYTIHRDIPSLTSVLPAHSTVPSVAIHPEGADPLLLAILILVGLVLITTGLLLIGLLCYRKRKTVAEGNCSCLKGYHKPQTNQACCRTHLQPSDSELISYMDDASSSGISPSPEYAEPDLLKIGANGQKVPSTFKPAPDEGYTLPLVVNHYDVPLKYHEYTEPLPPEPEYATPFTDQALAPTTRRNICIVKVIPPAQGKSAPMPTADLQCQYDSPAQRGTMEEADRTVDAVAGAPGGYSKAGALHGKLLPDGTLTGGGAACRELPPVPRSHFQTRDSLPHVYQEPV